MDRIGDARRLRRLYKTRVPAGTTQEQFGELHGIGTKGMVSQYLTGHRPLNIDTVAKFAKGLGCTIEDISPYIAYRL
jgi:transcriptional regulator with XRE-family HTH domain